MDDPINLVITEPDFIQPPTEPPVVKQSRRKSIKQ